MNLHDIANIENINCLIDLHLHLDGALTIDIIKQLAESSNIELTMSDDELNKQIKVSTECKDLNEFLTKFAFPLEFLQTKENIKLATKLVINKQAKEELIYCEVRFAPQLHLNKGLSIEEVVNAAIEGVKEADIPATLILCAMRGAKNELNDETFRVASKYLNNGVGGVDLAGAEALFPTKDYKNLFALANDLNIPFTIHAGEAAGEESLKDALSFNTARIGHGVRSIENIEVLQEISNKNVTLELCPTSNLNTCVIKEIEQFPIERLMEEGIRITINQDDPAISGITLKHEWDLLIKTFNLTYLEVKEMLLNSVNASFTSLTNKILLSNIIKESFKRIQNELEIQ